MQFYQMFALCYLIFLILICSFIYPWKKKGRTATKTTFINISPPLRWLQVILRKKKKKAFNWNNWRKWWRQMLELSWLKYLNTKLMSLQWFFLFYFIWQCRGHGIKDLSSPTKDGTTHLAVEARHPHHWTTGKYPQIFILNGMKLLEKAVFVWSYSWEWEIS